MSLNRLSVKKGSARRGSSVDVFVSEQNGQGTSMKCFNVKKKNTRAERLFFSLIRNIVLSF